MRLRKRRNADARQLKAAFLYNSPEETEKLRGNWRALYGGTALALEIGCGRGRFIAATAAAEPETLFVAVERDDTALLLTAEKGLLAELSNLRCLPINAQELPKIFGEGELDRLYLNFSDPWPKSRYAKRRLTHRAMLALYSKVLKKDALIHMKTDNQGLFEFSLAEFSVAGFVLEEVHLDFHKTGIANVMTEYEEKFSSQGMPIYHLIARNRKDA